MFRNEIIIKGELRRKWNGVSGATSTIDWKSANSVRQEVCVMGTKIEISTRINPLYELCLNLVLYTSGSVFEMFTGRGENLYGTVVHFKSPYKSQNCQIHAHFNFMFLLDWPRVKS